MNDTELASFITDLRSRIDAAGAAIVDLATENKGLDLSDLRARLSELDTEIQVLCAEHGVSHLFGASN